MKKNCLVRVVLCGLVCLTSANIAAESKAKPKKASSKKRWVVDTIVARVNGVNILKSDLERPQIGKEGGMYSLGEYIGEELLFQRAQEKNMLPNVADIDRQITSFKMQLGIDTSSTEIFEEHLKQFGFTVDAYRRQLGRMLSVNNIRQAEFSERSLVTSQEVEEYHKKNPAVVQDRYHFTMALFTPENIDAHKQMIADDLVEWKDFGFLAADEVDPRYEKAMHLSVGAMTSPIQVGGKYAVIKLLDKEKGHPLKLEERYGDIEKLLQQERRDAFVKTFQEELKAKAFISFP